jgi:hypothetical protein
MDLQPASYWFSFYDPNFDRIFYSRMYSSRCTFIKRNGEQCKNKCCIGIELCRTHVTIEKHLQIKKSTIANAGLGLFAYKINSGQNDIIFKKDQIICDYEGEEIDEDELRHRYHQYTAPYCIQIANDEYLDSALERGIGSLANNKPHHNNAKFCISKRNGQSRVTIKATQNIRQGNEIFIAYGLGYKLPHIEHVNYYSKKYPTKF